MTNVKPKTQRRGRSQASARNGVPKRASLAHAEPDPHDFDAAELQPVDLATVRQHIRGLVGHRAVKLVARMTSEVEQGNFQALKYLFEMVGLFPAPAEQEMEEDDSLAKTLLTRLGILEGAEENADREADGVAGPVGPKSNAVK